MTNIDNTIFIHGRLTKDIELETGRSGAVFARFSVAVDRRGKNDSDVTDFFDCIAFGESAKTLERYFYKGKPIRIIGRMECDPYTAKDGTKRYPWTVKVDNWGFDLNEGQRGSGTAPRQEAPAEPAQDLSDFGDTMDAQADDIPF